MELLTGFVAESTNSLLKAAIGRIVQEIELARGFKADLRDLERQLRRLDAILCGARSGVGNNRDLDEWLKEIRKVAYRAEDVMDEYSYELLKRKIALRNRPQHLRRFKTKTRFFFSLSSNRVAFQLKMAHRVKSIKESINVIYDGAKQHGISPVEVAGGKSYVYDSSDHDHNVTAVSLQRQMPYSEVLIERKDAQDDVVRWLREASDSDRHLSVVGIWGMAGLGKTTLCESIFKTAEINREFEERIWICVSHDFEFIQLLNRVIEKIGGQHPSNILDLHTLEAKLVDIMKGRKFLLVLDDIWDTFEKYWDTLRRCLKDVGASRGNAILATSRLKGTLEKSDAFRILPLEKLSDEDSQTLFKHCVGEINLSVPTKANLGWKMLSKCDGVPLAIKALGGVLKSQNSMSQWTKIEQDHNIWNKVDDILPSVKLSFKYLPSALLKQCFAFCAIFEEDEVIKKDRLIQLWMAQGFLQPYDHEKEQLCDELLGEKFLHILLNYSLFQEASFDYLGNVRTCKMHDVVRSLALDISKGDTEIIERRSLHLQEGWLSKLSNGSSASFDISLKDEFIKKAKHLRALSLVSVGLEELPDWIGELKHLRYLDISRNRIKSLPIGLGKLHYLQTLIIKVYNFHRCLPAAMFPKEFTNLNNLRHLCSEAEMEIPVGLGMLTSLQTLPAIHLNKCSRGGTASELGNLHNLKGRLRLRGFSDAGIIEELKKVKLGTKENLENLDLMFASHVHRNLEDVNHVMMLEALEPHPNLLALEIYEYQSKALPNWMMEMTGYGGHGLDNLVSLTIANCCVLEQLPSMKNLSALKVLKISWCDKAKSLQNLECLTSLQRLDLLKCFEMQNLSDISSLSYLEVLRIGDCRKMTCLPTGLSNLPNLRTLKICGLSPDVSIFPFPNLTPPSPLSTSLRQLYIQAYEMDKVVNLPSQIQHLSQLRCLEIVAFNSLKELPEWLGNLTSLETLVLNLLPLVEYLPSQATMKSLSQLMTLRIFGCPQLKQACSPDGSEWIKIQHIRHIYLS